jgi:RNA polymerase sigma factor (TIGR02999 family)
MSSVAIGSAGMSSDADTCLLLARWQAGESQTLDRLIAKLYPELAQIAAARLRGEKDSSLSTGDLINDAVIRLMEIEGVSLTNRAHFIALASRLMRNILVDRARMRSTAKRQHIKIELCTAVDGARRIDLCVLESALVRLGAIDERLTELVEMRYFGGMTVADISVVTGWSEPTVKRRWQTARAWLTDALTHPIEHV